MDSSYTDEQADIIGLYDDYFKYETVFCSAFDELFDMNKYKKATEEDIEYLRNCLQHEVNIDDNVFIEQLLFIFSNKLNVELIRKLTHLTDYFTNNINVFTAFSKLKDLYEKITQNNEGDKYYNVVSFLRFLLFEPIEFLRSEKQYIDTLGFHYTPNLLKDYKQLVKRDIYNGKTPCILSFICSNSGTVHELVRKENKDLLMPKYIPDKDQYGNDYFDIIILQFYQTM